MTRAVTTALGSVLVAGCYLAHSPEPGDPRLGADASMDGSTARRDAGRGGRDDASAGDASPRDGSARDARRDGTGPPLPACTDGWRRTDLGRFPGTTTGPVAASRSTIAWLTRDESWRLGLTRVDRRTLERNDEPLDSEIGLATDILFTGERFAIAYEMGPAPVGWDARVRVAEDGVDARVGEAVSFLGGSPRLTHGDSARRVLVAYTASRGLTIAELDVRTGATTESPWALVGDSAFDAARAPGAVLAATTSRILRVRLDSFEESVFAPSPGSFTFFIIASNDDAVVGWTGTLLRMWRFDGSIIDDRDDFATGELLRVAAYRNWFLRVEVTTGRAAVSAETLDSVYDPGDFGAHDRMFFPEVVAVSETPTGFVVLSSERSTGQDPLVTLIDRCEDL